MSQKDKLLEIDTEESAESFKVYTDQQLRDLKPLDVSYDTIQLKSNLDTSVPCGFSKLPGRRDRVIRKKSLLYNLRSKITQNPNSPLKLAVCITMYNEDENELQTTMRGVLEGYQKLHQDPSLEFNEDNFLVFVVCDGEARIPESFKQYATKHKFYDEEKLLHNEYYMKRDPKNPEVKRMRELSELVEDNEELPEFNNIMHLFQLKTWDFGLRDPPHRMRVNFIFGLKQRNDGKINSHRWFFQGICQYLDPQYCLMLDIGTRPAPHSIYKLYNYMTETQHCGGCCGEIEVDFSEERQISSSFFIKAAQFFEYKMAHTPDKSCESVFGVQSVLPGAYSLFRWEAIVGRPLSEFYKGVESKKDLTCPEANKYLAEDRVMCLEIMIKRDSRYELTYVMDAKAFTDAPPSLAVLLKQRRRWINGSLFGTYHVINHFCDMISCSRTRHSKCRQFCVCLFLIYYVLTFLFQFFLIGGLYAATTTYITNEIRNDFQDTEGFFGSLMKSADTIFSYTYLILLFLSIMVSLSEPVDKGMCKYYCILVIFGIVGYLLYIGLIFALCVNGYTSGKKEREQMDGLSINLLAIGVTISLSSFIMPMLLRPGDFCANIVRYTVGFVIYLFLFPTFATVLQIYAMANLHDISWGNRPAQSGSQGIEAVAYNKENQEKLKMEYQKFRSNFLYIWVVLNGAYGLAISGLVGSSSYGPGESNWSIWFLIGFSLFVSLLVVFKSIAALFYVCYWKGFRSCCSCCIKRRRSDSDYVQGRLHENQKRITRMTRFTEYQRHIERPRPPLPDPRMQISQDIFDPAEGSRSNNDPSNIRSYEHDSDAISLHSDADSIE